MCSLATLALFGAGEDTADDMFKQLAMTLLQESHLCPVPLESQAVYWQHDHALALYPLPHLLVLADSVPPNSTTFEDCHCLNPVRILLFPMRPPKLSCLSGSAFAQGGHSENYQMMRPVPAP